MKSFILALIFVMTSLNAMSYNVGDTIVLEKHENGCAKKKYTILSEGYKVISYYETGEISEVGYFNANKEKSGEWISYYRNGQINSKANFQNDKKDGIWEFYDFTGKMFMTLNYVSGKFKYAFTVDQNGGLIVKQ
jgi:antitoxin component YwqK of YwqJK toxin-antitoxin module